MKLSVKIAFWFQFDSPELNQLDTPILKFSPSYIGGSARTISKIPNRKYEERIIFTKTLKSIGKFNRAAVLIGLENFIIGKSSAYLN